LICWWVPRLPEFGYYEQCCNKHGRAYISIIYWLTFLQNVI
jgi:hypothetical protein